MNTQQMKLYSNNEYVIAKKFQLSLVFIFGLLFLLTSNLAFMSQAEAASCGGLNQKGCKLTFKRLKACDKGLHLKLKTKRCVSNKVFKPIPKQKNCGKLGQRACKLIPPRVKACNLHLVKDKRTGKCRKIKSIIPPKQKNCGKLGQRACKLIPPRVKACDLLLVKDKKTGKCRKVKSILPPKQKNCGKLGQRACKLIPPRVKACDLLLVKDKQTGKCRKLRMKANPLAIIGTAKNIAKESVSLIKIMVAGHSCYVLNPPLATAAINALQGKKREKSFVKELKHIINKKDVNAAIRLASSKCMQKTVAVAAREGYNTITVGVASGGSAVAGSFLDTGFAFDIKALNRYFKKQTNTLPIPTLYQTKGGSIGVQAGVGNSFSMGLSKGKNKADSKGSGTHGATLALAAVAGVGTGIWFDYDNQLDGISAAITGGAEFEAAYNRQVTHTYNLPKPTQQPKSRPTQKPKPRNNGLNCGANGQRVCTIQEQVPGCNSGLKIDFNIKRCVYK